MDWGKAIGTAAGGYFGGPAGAAIGGEAGSWLEDEFFDKGDDKPDKMSFDDAYGQAEQMMEPKFNQQRQELSRNQRERGFHGQLPGDIAEQSLGQQQEAQLSQTAMDIQNQDFNQQMQQQEMEMQQPGAGDYLGQGLGQFLGGQGGEAFAEHAIDEGWLENLFSF